VRSQALVLLALTACGGGGVSSVPSTPTVNTDSVLRDAASAMPLPTQTPGFQPIAQSYVSLLVFGGGVRGSGAVANPPQNGYALAFAANGDFLRALRGPERLPMLTAYELDVRTAPPDLTLFPLTPYVATIPFERQGWILSGGKFEIAPSETTNPWAVHLKSIRPLPLGATISGQDVPPPSPFLAWDANTGQLLGLFFDQGGLDFVYTAPVNATVVFSSAGWPQSHCGNCWMILQH
jgi:hypothetical protein